MPAPEPVNEINLLDFDSTPTTTSTAPAAGSGGGGVNLMDDLFSSGPTQPQQPSVNQQLSDILGAG